ncbi:MAG: endolytic transglycosylase MltG [Leptolyngbyaceae bacterium]|nr:endolytic transglycosylase MltG [Leptolyngbyaceae bacterium]
MNRWSKWVFYLLLFPVALGLSGWQGWQWWSWAIAPVDATETETDDRSFDIEIEDGTTARQIGETLSDEGLIRSSTAWNLWTRWQTLLDRPGGFLAGTYEISTTESMPTIANRIWEGDVKTGSLTIPEGWAIADMATYLDSEGLMTEADFLAAAQSVSPQDYPWLPNAVFSVEGANLEGFLFPDTYEVLEGMTADQLVAQMLNRFEEVGLPLYDRSRSPYSLMEWVTLASIVEKEAVVSEEREEIAAVFARRLREGIALGSDPTVEYALGIQQTPENPLTFTDIRVASPYNTYRYPGLPPGPIASPGVASLEESLNPRDTEYLYFVARYDGTHVFSQTLAEHEAAQAEIRQRIDGQ